MTSSPAFDLVVFDLDGTLIETAQEICDAVNDTLCEHGLGVVNEQQICDWIGHGTHTTLVRALAFVQATSTDLVRANPDTALISKRFDGHYLQRCGTRSYLYPNVAATLDALHNMGIRLALVTNKESRYTRRILAAHKLAGLFDRVVSGDDVTLKKPDPEGVLACIEEFCVAKHRVLYVGDSAVDAQTARRAGIAVWLVNYGYNAGEAVAACHPDRVISDVSSVMDAVTTV